MSEYPTDIYLADLTTEDGLVVRGAGENDFLGQGAAAIGDINGDGIDDFMVGAFYADANGSNSGAAYVVFGTIGGFPPSLDLNSLDGTNGFRLAGPAGSALGYAGAGADLNGDGFGDLIVTAPALGGGNRGGAYIIYGHEGPFDAAVDLAAPVAGVSTRINNATVNDWMGKFASNVGDLNGDGVDDFALSTDRGSGSAYVIFGNRNGLPPDINLSQLDGANGFKITGQLSGWNLGSSIASAGDINGDGRDDLIVGAPGYDVSGSDNTGAAFVIYGRDSFGATVDVTALNGSEGFRIVGERAGDNFGRSVAGAGDYDGDGHDDLIIAARGKAFLVYGEATAPTGINFTTGTGIHQVLRLTYPASTASLYVDGGFDFNADGRSDILIGGPGLNANQGGVYLIFGGAREPALLMTDIVAAHGVSIHGPGAITLTFAVTITELGDVNGDGVADFFIGDQGDDIAAFNAGAGYIIYGRPEARDFTGGAGDDVAAGGLGADTLLGGGGKDSLSGMRGADLIDGGDGNDQLFGGGENDQMFGGLGGDILYGEDGDDVLDGGDGADKLFGGAGADDLTAGLGNDRLDGGDGIDTLAGGDGNDYLDGGAGADILIGGLGNDVYIAGAGDILTEGVGEGYDIVRTDVDGWVLGDNFEGLELQGTGNISGYGNAGANNLQGNSGDNRLDGGAGVDTINGGDGDDTIIGGLGNDLLRGGTGADSFVVAHAFGPVLETDQVYDFSAAEGDIIDLSDAYAGTVSLVSAFSKQAGQMTLTFAGGITTLKLDVNGDGKVDYQMKINGDVTGESGSWLL